MWKSDGNVYTDMWKSDGNAVLCSVNLITYSSWQLHVILDNISSSSLCLTPHYTYKLI